MLHKKKELADKEGDNVSKQALFDSKNTYYIDMNTTVVNNDWVKFTGGMTTVAITIKMWTKLLNDGLEDKELRGGMCAEISK